MKVLTQKRLKKLIHYDPKTGIPIWIIKRPHCKTNIGDVAGTVCVLGYRRIMIDGKYYKAHRLAFLYMEGYFPENDIDHIDQNPLNNKWNNLREVSKSCNTINSKVSIRNTSGVVGVHYIEKSGKWRVRIFIKGKLLSLGVFKNFKHAVKARWEAEKKYNFPNCNTNSSARLFIIKGFAQ